MDERDTDRRTELRQDIVEKQGEFEDALLDLRSMVEGEIARFDLRRRIVEAPLPWLTGAFVVGLMVGMRRR